MLMPAANMVKLTEVAEVIVTSPMRRVVETRMVDVEAGK